MVEFDERAKRVQAASQGAGSAADRERKILQQNAQEVVNAQLSGSGNVSQAEFERARAIAGGFLDPVSGRPSGKTLQPRPQSTNIIRGKQPNLSLVSPFLKGNNPSQDLRIKQNQFKDTLIPNITGSNASIRTPDGIVKTLEDEDLTFEELEALQIISGQQAATKSFAQQISARRRAAKLLGATDAEAQKFAVSGESSFNGFEVSPVSSSFINEKGEFGFGKTTQSNVNTILQQRQVRRNAAKLDAAERVIKNQTTSGKAGDLNNLQNILNAIPDQDKPVQRLIVSTDERGNVVSPRNVALQTQNAFLTGTDENFNVDVQTSGGRELTQSGENAPNIQQINDIIRGAIADISGSTGLPEDIVTSRQGVDGEILIDFADGVPLEIREESAEKISGTLTDFFSGVSQQSIKDDILNGQILDLGQIVPNFPDIESRIGGSGGSGFGDLVNSSNPLIILGLIGVIGVSTVLLLRSRKK